MGEFKFQVPGRIVFGIDSSKKLGNEMRGYGNRILLVTETVLHEWDIPTRVREVLEESGKSCIVYDEIENHSTSSQVDKGVALARKGKVQAVVGLGGVRTISIARCIAALAAGKNRIEDYLEGMPFDNQAVPFIELPTTCRDPFMISDRCVLVDGRNRDVMGLVTGTFPDLVVIDPSFTVSLSPKFTAMTMLDTFLCALEGLVSKRSTFLSDSLFLRAIRSILSSINQSISEPENLIHREAASQAGFLTALGLSMSATGIGFGLSHAISAKYRIPQSWVSSVFLPALLEYHRHTAPEKIARIYDILDKNSAQYGKTREESTGAELAALAVDAVRHLIASLRLPMRLSQFDLSLEQLYSVAETGRNFPGVEAMPAPVTSEDVYALMKESF